MDRRRLCYQARLRHPTARLASESQTNRTLRSGSVNHVPMLRHNNLPRRNQAPRSSPRRLHQPLPIPPVLQPSHRLRRLGRTDRLVSPTLREQFQNHLLKLHISLSRLVPSARIAAVLDHIPIPLPRFTPLEGTATGLADLLLVRRSALGFASSVRHRKKDAEGSGVIHPPMRILKKFYKKVAYFLTAKK